MNDNFTFEFIVWLLLNWKRAHCQYSPKSQNSAMVNTSGFFGCVCIHFSNVLVLLQSSNVPPSSSTMSAASVPPVTGSFTPGLPPYGMPPPGFIPPSPGIPPPFGVPMPNMVTPPVFGVPSFGGPSVTSGFNYFSTTVQYESNSSLLILFRVFPSRWRSWTRSCSGEVWICLFFPHCHDLSRDRFMIHLWQSFNRKTFSSF